MKLFGREPALWMSLFSCTVMFVSAFFFPLTIAQQGALNALCVGGFGVATAFLVAKDGLSSAILGGIKAILALFLSFGLAWPADKQAMVMTLASAVVAMFVRTQVTAPVTAAKSPL